MSRLSLLFVALTAMALVACAPVEGDDIGEPIFNGTTPDGVVVEPPVTTLPIPDVDAIRVPFDHFSIQEAVNVAQPGDLILLDPGVYTEEVTISTPDIVIRGRDRNTVFIDGLHSAATGVIVRASGVGIENLTVRNFTGDAIRVEPIDPAVPIDGFRALHVTTSNTGGDGIAAYGSRNVDIRQVWASGHGVAGVAIRDCVACNTLIEITLVEFSATGFRIEGAAGDVTILRSTARNNRLGVAIEDRGATETEGAVVTGSVITNNGFSNTPNAFDPADTGFGVGVRVAGTTGTRIEANRILGNTRAGVLLVDAPDAVVTGNLNESHPDGDVADGSSWADIVRPTIPYQNGPVPPGIDGMLDADEKLPIPAGPVAPVDFAGVVVPEA